MDDVTERVIQVIAKAQHIPVENVKAESTFEELKIDSLDGLQIVFALEEEFDISIPDEEAKALRSIGQAVSGIKQLLAAKAAATA
ncbi:MAG: acyl carrier protein [Bryobacteraceae bacterium]|nr:acyl carrier protein [Bryobacteraceae bacterium]